MDSSTPEGLKKLKKALHEASVYMTQEVKEEEIIVTIGGTRAGKSTLVNYLIGNDLEGKRLSSCQPITLLKVNNDSPGPDIGAGTTSKTTVPNKWISEKLPELAIWDLPGFDDNRGPIQDITNAFYIYQLVQKVKSLKIALVVDINDILHDNVKNFVSVLDAFRILLGDKMEEGFQSVSVIFTKVPDSFDEIEINKEFLNEKLSYQFLSNTEMCLQNTSRAFITFLIENNNHIAFFKRAKLGPITTDIDVDIFPAIENSKHVEKETLKEVNPSISESSKIYLFKARESLFQIVVFDDLGKIVDDVCSNGVRDLRYSIHDADCKRLCDKLKVIQGHLVRALDKETNFQEKLKILQSVDNKISLMIEKQTLFEKIQLMEFVDKLLKMKTSSQLLVKLQIVILSSMSRVTEAISSAQLRNGEISQQKYDEMLRREREEHKREKDRLDDRMRELKDENEKTQRKLWQVKSLMTTARGFCD